RKFDVEPVFGRMKRDFGVRRTHLRGQRSVENDLGLVLMAMNLTKLGKIVAHMRPLLLKNGKNRTTIFEKSKIMVRFSILNVKIKIVYSQPLFSHSLVHSLSAFVRGFAKLIIFSQYLPNWPEKRLICDPKSDIV